MTEAEQIMKRCQAGTRNYEEANNLHAACYGIIGKLLAQRTWVGLTRMDLIKCGVLPFGMSYELCQAVEAQLKQKNG